MSDGDYKVGYGKPPKHSQFVPGESGNKGRRKKAPESHQKIFAQARDEVVEVGGVKMTVFQLAVRSAFAKAIKSGKVSDVKLLIELSEKYGGPPAADIYAESKAAAESVMKKIMTAFDRRTDRDPERVSKIEALGQDEAKMVMDCKCCGPTLRRGWHTDERKALAKDNYRTSLQSEVDRLQQKERSG